MAIGATSMVTDTFRFYIYIRGKVSVIMKARPMRLVSELCCHPSSHITMITDGGNGEGRGQRDGGTS